MRIPLLCMCVFVNMFVFSCVPLHECVFFNANVCVCARVCDCLVCLHCCVFENVCLQLCEVQKRKLIFTYTQVSVCF